MSHRMKVLVACEFSGRVRDAFARRGHDAWSCDILPSETPGNHIQGDVLKVLDRGWDLMIAHPPCTYLSYAAMHVWNQPDRLKKRLKALNFFAKLWTAPIEKICIENPKGCASPTIAKYSQEIQPYYFGESHLKTTWLWLKNLPPLWYWEHENSFFQKTATEYPMPIYVDNTTRGKKRHFTDAGHGGHNRSRTFQSIADAMAEQWGGNVP